MRNLQVLLLLLITLTVYSQTQTSSTIYFQSDEYTLDKSDVSNLHSLLTDLKGFNDVELHIIGHTDPDGSESYNMDLSRKRAESVKQFFVENQIDQAAIKLSYKGESQLINQSSESVAKGKNRRVTIRTSGYNYSNVNEMLSLLNISEPNTFEIDVTEENQFKLSKGTEVTIPNDAFCHMDGTPISGNEVVMKFKEAFDFQDMVDERLFTQTEDKILETGGMIHIEASQDGKPLKLKDGKEIELIFPLQESKEGMELFLGNEDDNGTIWEPTGQEITSRVDRSNVPPIFIDLTPILEFDFENLEEAPTLTFSEMMPYPKPARKSYKPFKENYSEEGYEEAMRKYNKVMEAYEKDKLERPEKLSAWNKEVNRRFSILKRHFKQSHNKEIIDKLKLNIFRLKDKKDEICNDRLVNALFNFMESEVGRIEYDTRQYLVKTFDKVTGDVVKYRGIDLPAYNMYLGYHFIPGFADALNEVRNNISRKKYEMGIVDKDVLGRYIVRSANLGWINCDRFLEVSDDRKTRLEFAKVSSDDQFFLIFKDIKSLIRPIDRNGKAVFKDVPLGEDVRLVAVSMKNGNAKMARRDFKIGSQRSNKLTFFNIGVEELKTAFSDI